MEATALEIEQVNKWYAADVHAVRAIVTDVERTCRESLLFLNLPGMPVLTAAVGADCARCPGEETGVILTAAGSTFLIGRRSRGCKSVRGVCRDGGI